MVATRFAVALHVLLLLGCGQRRGPATSQAIAESVNTNPVVVRRITGHLARAGLVRVRRGPGGAVLTRPPEQITLADVWKAMNAASQAATARDRAVAVGAADPYAALLGAAEGVPGA